MCQVHNIFPLFHWNLFWILKGSVCFEHFIGSGAQYIAFWINFEYSNRSLVMGSSKEFFMSVSGRNIPSGVDGSSHYHFKMFS